MKKVYATTNAPSAIGPYSQAVQAGDVVFVSGQLPIDPATGEFAGADIASQTKQSLTNIKAILESQGLGMEDVVKTTVFLADIRDFAAINTIYANYFTGEAPARSCVQAAALPKGALFEIEAVAVK